MAYDRKDLIEIQERWFITFGERLGIGFGIYPDDIPVLERCIETGSMEPLNAVLARRFDDLDLYMDL